jgi:ATP-binding cassette, subfamily F, member 3
MAVAIASELGKDVAGAPLLRDVSFKVERGDRLTVAGRNGSGKTTLLRMLAGEASIDFGQLVLAKGTRVALHDQRPPRERDLTLRDYVLSGRADLIALERELEELERAMAGGDAAAATLERYARAQERLELAGGYTWRERALAQATALGFAHATLERPLASFSGGELTRASLARALAMEADLLLLDEPTNHLDIASLEWLEGALTSSDSAVVLVAHDRWFLEAVGTAVLELAGGRGRYFSGPWHAWRKEAAAQELALGRAIDRQQREIERLERFVARFRAGTRARQAQSRLKRLDKVERISRAARDGKGLGFEFAAPSRTGRVVFEIVGGELAAGDRKLLDGFDFWLERGEHVSLVGPNGAGKTTLLEALAGSRALDAGKLRRGHNVEVGYLSQHADEIGGDGTVLEVTQRATKLTPNKARALLGRFLFGGDEADKPVAALSGGERRRLSLAIVVQSVANVLILDEPTNHLDVDSREALEDALASFPGSLLLVSHDRALLDAVGTRTVAIEDGRLRSYAGGWAEYVRAREEQAAEPKPKPKQPARKQAPPRPSKERQRRAAAIEREIEAAEAALAAVEDELADPAAWSSPSRSARSTERHAEAKAAVERLYGELEATGG